MSSTEKTTLAPTAHRVRKFRAFSPARIVTLAGNTFTQLLRMKVLYFLVVFVALVFLLGFVMPAAPSTSGLTSLGGEQDLRLLKAASLGGMSMFTVLLSIAATALLLPRDLEDRTLYTILCKPVPRFEYLAGKWLGVLLLLGVSLFVMDAVTCGLIYAKQSQLLGNEIDFLQHRKWPSQALLDQSIAEVRQIYAAQGLRWNFQQAVVGIFCQAGVMAALSLLISTISSSTLFTILIGLAFFIIGQGQELARDYLFRDLVPGGQKAVSVLLALLFPDLRQFNVVDEVVGGQVIPTAVLLKMVGIAALYAAFYQIAGWFVFSDKEL